jgi:hypothetical protein
MAEGGSNHVSLSRDIVGCCLGNLTGMEVTATPDLRRHQFIKGFQSWCLDAVYSSRNYSALQEMHPRGVFLGNFFKKLQRLNANFETP